jgi:carbon-monoxide dehydrogenase medium subunit
MKLWEYYHLAQDVNDALSVLAASPGPARIISGVTSPILKEQAQALVEACHEIGGPQVRNTATLGGNVAHALPAADGTIALLALDAQAEVATFELGTEERRLVPLEQMFLGPGQSALDPGSELLVGFRIAPGNKESASSFQRVMRPQGVAIAILNMAVWLQRRDDLVEDIHIAVGPAGPIPFRMSAAEDVLRDQPFDDLLRERALEALQSEARFRTSRHRSTKAYRQHIADVLFNEVLTRTWERTCR